MVVKFKESQTKVSVEGFIGDLFGRLLGRTEEGQVVVKYDAEFEGRIIEAFQATYLNDTWMAGKTEQSGSVLVDINALSVNGAYPSDVTSAVERFVKDTIAYRKKYLPILKRYHDDTASVLRATLKLKDTQAMLDFCKPKLLELRKDLIKNAPTFPLLGMTLTDNKERIVHQSGSNRKNVKALSKKDIQRISLAIVDYVKDVEDSWRIEERFNTQDYEDLIEDEFSDYVDEYEDDVYELAGMFDSVNGFAGDYLDDIKIKVVRAFRTLDVYMAKSLK